MNKLDVLAKINPQMKAVLAKEDELAGDANDTSVGFEQMRENYVAGRAFWAEGGPVMAEKRDFAVAGPHGAIPVRFYYPTQETLRGCSTGSPETPGIVYVHGGGFVLGNLDTHDRFCRILAEKTGAVLVAVDYRLSPEAKFPSAVEEVAAVARYLHERGAVHGIDGERLAFAGDSGGAHLDLAATLYLREECGGADWVKCLMLYYGWFGLKDSASMRLLGGPWDGLTEEDWLYYRTMYASDVAELEASPYANLFLNDLTRDMPACYVAAAGLDPLRDDSAALAAILEEHGIPCRYEAFEGVIHAFLHYTKMLDEANDALEHGATFYRQQLGW
ncbi:MAG: acetyl esterase [Gordonibacter sp.]|uniref:acetyl esterase n=1 Tax=Gordonibacter sp. TaxID=1968902 RepID=UPI002FC5E301